MLTFFLLALSLLCWPDLRAQRRLCALTSTTAGKPGAAAVRAARIGWIPATAALGALLAGVGGLFAAVALAVLGRRYVRSRRSFRAGVERSAELSGGIRLLVAGLRAGAHPAVAAEGAAEDSAPAISGVFRDLASAAKLGGDVPTVLDNGGHPAELRQPLARLGRAWRLAERHGVALADLLDAVRRDVDHRVAFVRDLESKMAGPRATAAMLAGLPLLGLLLGEAVGAAPLSVLTGQAFGQAVLVVGVGLLCAGLFWTLRLTEGAMSP
ncbi:type II secretion system F family protein [Saccharopolyspora erythraea]|uniref:type II secretion system F family protein n=1 Tax=Saccharopolyspora erythraea TaxID=1836 RepID=UPI001BADD4F5|nr:type II secretion system F family protein [Saccharopolyspora erythraea]QUG99725.1 type II secretion system F family protein [Saccharopolyspora erythraea]